MAYVLIIGDDPDFRAACENALSATDWLMGFAICQLSQVQTALSLNRPDIVVLGPSYSLDQNITPTQIITMCPWIPSILLATNHHVRQGKLHHQPIAGHLTKSDVPTKLHRLINEVLDGRLEPVV